MNSYQVATSVIDNAIEASQGPLPPAFLVEFLLDPWRSFLAITHTNHGESSEEWKQAVRATELLLWSIAPKATDADRASLTKSLASLLDSIRKATDVAGWQPAQRTAFLRQLSNWHVQLISRSAAATEAALGENVSARGAATATKVDLDDTVQVDVRDPRYREFVDMLNHASLEKIEI
jgi:hypothetical protein